MNPFDLRGQTALVTGASRGVGKGIAMSLAEAGAMVYITGRTTKEGEGPGGMSGSVLGTAEEIQAAGGQCIAIPCDHRDDEQVRRVFEQIKREQGRLDVLVNNVWGGYEHFFDGTPFWEESGFWTAPVSCWDSMFAAGVRAHYVSSCLAASLMVEQKSGLIVNISYFAAQRNDKGVAYGAAKAASDRMAQSMAHELHPHGVSAVSLYPGLVRTEAVLKAQEFFDMSNSESPQFVGLAVAALASDPNLLAKSGQIFVAAQVALDYGYVDIDGFSPRPITVEEA